MGDYANDSLDRDFNQWLDSGCPQEERRFVFGHITCKYCNKSELAWLKIDNKWKLLECDNYFPGGPNIAKIHTCKSKQKDSRTFKCYQGKAIEVIK